MEEGDLGQLKVEGESSLEWGGPLWSRGGPWDLGGMEEDGEGAHETNRDHRKGCVRTGDLDYPGPLMTDLEVDVRKAAAVVWFWDKNLVKAGAAQVEVGRGPTWIPLLQTAVVEDQVESGGEEVVSPTLEAACSPSHPQCWRLVCGPAGNERTPRWFPAPRGTDAPRQLTA